MARPRPGALADRLGGEEGIEDLALDLLRHAGAGVGHFDAHIIARRHDGGAQCARLRHGLIGGVDGHRAAGRHGVAGIDHQVDDGVAELGFVGMHRPEIGHRVRALSAMPSPTSRRSIWASSPITSPSASTLGCMVCLRLKASKLAHQRGGAQRVLMNLVDFLERGIARLMAHQKEFAIADDDGEQVVEVVRHAARELAHRLHLLRLGEFGLQRLLLGDVHQIEDRPAGHGTGQKLGHALVAIGGLQAAQFDRLQAHLAGRGACDQRHDLGAIARIHQVAEILSGQGRGHAEEFCQRRVGIADHRRGHRQMPRPWAHRGRDRRHSAAPPAQA